mmetsp:Transcript_8643/g.17526  ORF Transcript_8643/g.17526 Transcript_8643/m.17526 type:complete len:228 (+) Transcript_8643:3-686(+)
MSAERVRVYSDLSPIHFYTSPSTPHKASHTPPRISALGSSISDRPRRLPLTSPSPSRYKYLHLQHTNTHTHSHTHTHTHTHSERSTPPRLVFTIDYNHCISQVFFWSNRSPSWPSLRRVNNATLQHGQSISGRTWTKFMISFQKQSCGFWYQLWFVCCFPSTFRILLSLQISARPRGHRPGQVRYPLTEIAAYQASSFLYRPQRNDSRCRYQPSLLSYFSPHSWGAW